MGAGLVVLTLAAPVERSIEATVRLERLADKAERASRMPLETALELVALTRNPSHDCRQMRCTSDVAARNAKARERLQGLAATALAQAPEGGTHSLLKAPISPAALRE